jgi:hypothetical protein
MKKILRLIEWFLFILVLSVIAVVMQYLRINTNLILASVTVSVLIVYSFYAVKSSGFFLRKNREEKDYVAISEERVPDTGEQITSNQDAVRYISGVTDTMYLGGDSTWNPLLEKQTDLMIWNQDIDVSWLAKDSALINYDYLVSVTPEGPDDIEPLMISVADRINVGTMHEETIQATEEIKIVPSADNTESVYFSPQFDAAFA